MLPVAESARHAKKMEFKIGIGIGSVADPEERKMTKNDQLKLIRETGVVAIMRAQSSEQLITAAGAIMAGGVKVIEVTMTTPDALSVISEATKRYAGEVLFGAGTVLDSETARAAILAGAGFIVAPTLNLKVIKLCNRYGVPVMPGCATPTEMLTAWEAGADMIKLFPADVGGPDLVKAILAPLPQLQIVPVGGVDLNTAADFIRKGAVAVGVGSSLINQKLLDSGDMKELTRRAAAFIDEVKKGRQKLS
jgi:2-dehydro-3-deoxyphosphogluconate aldolase/(4S)-4-hydroxy-2-oxoglutarate aldolase